MDISFEDFAKVDIRSGTIIKVVPFPEARNPSFKVWVDFGETLGVKQTSAQITKLYTPESLVGQQVMGAVNLGTKRIAGFKSEFLLLGFSNNNDDIALASIDQSVPNGQRLH